MRIEKFYLLLLLLLSGCEKPFSPKLELSQTEFANVTYNETSFTVHITTNESWTATSSDSWCTLSAKSGDGDAQLTVYITGNIEKVRTASVTVKSVSNIIQTITITQDPMPSDEEYHYKLPVVFHVLYKDKTDELQYVNENRIGEILKEVNEYYRSSTNSVDMKLEFVLAETDEDGNALSIPGIDYVSWQNVPMDCEVFMRDNSGKYVSLLWDPNKYINVMLYNFTKNDPDNVILGISHMPYSITGENYLEGLISTTYTTIEKNNLKFPYCLSINSLYIDEKSSGQYYNPSDVSVTLAHELGHYLGLHHVFSESEEGGLSNNCLNSDYCADTPVYDRNAYLQELAVIFELAAGRQLYMDEVAARRNCETGAQFIARNIMDYEYCYSDQFTANQRDRVRNVLTYSPLIPGPKKGAAAARSGITDGHIDLPIVIRK